MKRRNGNILHFIANVLFCIIIVYFFGRNCYLRPGAYPLVYKEYLSGVIVLVLIYLNVLIIIPRILSGFNFIRYLLFFAATIFIATICEMAMVYPQAIAIIKCHYPLHTAHLYYVEDSFLVLLRNVGIIIFVLMTILLRNELHLGRRKSRFWLKHHGSLILTNTQQMLFEVPVDHVKYCEKCGNLIRFYLVDGKSGFMNCNMRNITSMMGKHGVQISRGTYVMLQHICMYDNETITMEENGKDSIKLKVSRAYSDRVSQRLTRYKKTAVNPYNPLGANQKHMAIMKKSDGTIGKKTMLIYTYIANNPFCSAEDIMAQTDLSRSSVAKYIARLKQQGLIEHVGANKTGGYRVVNS